MVRGVGGMVRAVWECGCMGVWVWVCVVRRTGEPKGMVQAVR